VICLYQSSNFRGLFPFISDFFNELLSFLYTFPSQLGTMMAMKKNTPIYKKIRSDLLQEIMDGKYSAQQLPTEAELCERYGVSRMTVNKGLSMLSHEGLIRRIPGKGSFINTNEIQKKISEPRGFTQDINALGRIPSTKLLLLKKLRASDVGEIARIFNLQNNSRVFYFERLRFSDGEPIAISRTFISGEVVKTITKSSLEKSFYKYLKNELGIIPRCSDYQIRARQANAQEEELLNNNGEPLLEVRHISYTEDDIPFEYNSAAYLGSKFYFVTGDAYLPRFEFEE